MNEASRPGVAVEAAARLQSFLRLAVEEPLERGLAEGDVDALRSAVERALAAMEDLHFLADGRIGERAVHDLAEMIQAYVERYEGDSELDLELVLPEEPVEVRVDENGFGDALFLILHNAERFGQGGAVRVAAQVEAPFARISVTDEGPGFSAEALSRAYDPFYSTTDTGLGLGLPQARHLIESMGGQIRISNSAVGGQVELFVPLV